LSNRYLGRFGPLRWGILSTTIPAFSVAVKLQVFGVEVVALHLS
jgi:hypothetical protein